jgi:hypothetical protein
MFNNVDLPLPEGAKQHDQLPSEKIEINAAQRAYFDSAGRVDLSKVTGAKKWSALCTLAKVGRLAAERRDL